MSFVGFVGDICSILKKKAKTFHKKAPVEYVNPLVGTDSNYNFSHGSTYPAITLPFGMTSWTPQTSTSRWIYGYKDKKFLGFRATHQSSVWVGDYGSFTVMPVSGALKITPENRGSNFSHEKEIVKPYYYKTFLEDYKIKAEIVGTVRSSISQFTFNKLDEEQFVVFDIQPGKGFIEFLPEKNKVRGYSLFCNGNVPDFKCYFVGEFEKPFLDYGYFKNYKEELEMNISGENVGGFVKFDSRNGNQVKLRISTSFISFEQAELSLGREINIWNLKRIKKHSKFIWNKKLSRIEINGGTLSEKISFYTALYHALLYPRTIHEYDNLAHPHHYSPYDGKIHKGVLYSDTGFWDTFRAFFPLMGLVYPEYCSDFIQGFLNAYDEGGWLPKWPSPSYRNVMIGTHSDSVIADAVIKNITNFDVHKAYKAILKNGTVSGDKNYEARVGLEYFCKEGYVPCDKIKEATSRTLEFAYDDFCIAVMAKLLGDKTNYEIFNKRAFNYKNVFNSKNNFMMGKNLDGTWKKNFNPIEWGNEFCEGSAWQYTWSVQHDIHGLIKLLGGKKNFLKKLDELFSMASNFSVGSYMKVIHEMREMQAAKMGQYCHPNEPQHHLIHLYNYAGKPAKTQYWVRKVMKELYKSGPDGLLGDEDTGQMSAWYLFNAMGFYPVCPGQPIYSIGSPVFSRITLHLPDNKKFIIKAINNKPKNKYIKSAKLNGKIYKNNWLSHFDIIKGGCLSLNMSSNSNQTWGMEESFIAESGVDFLKKLEFK